MLAVTFQVSRSVLIYSVIFKYSIIIVILFAWHLQLHFIALFSIFYSSSFHKGRGLQVPSQGLWFSAHFPIATNLQLGPPEETP